MNKSSLVFLHSLPFVLGIALSHFFWPNPWILLTLYFMLTVGFIYFGNDRKTETFIACYGILAGIIIEVSGAWNGYQKFTTPQFFGIPFWLILTWGYGFVLMKRIGFIIHSGTPWNK